MGNMKSLREVHELLGVEEGDTPISEFVKLYSKVHEKPCPSGDDCSDILSDCCGSILTTVFGTLPLEVSCTECGRQYLLKDVISE